MNILEDTDCENALTDQFGDEKFVLNALLKKGKNIKLVQRPRAEEDVGVAAASIFARDEFLRRLHKLSPILNPVSGPIKGKFPERYKLHQYWSRKPWYVVRQYIEHFTKEGDTILDPFVGSGITACEALIARRKIIATDLNPIATLITKITCLSPVDLNKFRDAFKRIERIISEEISPLYETKCPNCKNKIKEIEGKEVPFWYPKDVQLPKDADVKTLDRLFTKRNQIGLSIIYNEIQRLEESEIKEIMKLVFSSILVRTSKLIFVNNYRLNKGVNPAGVWGEKRFWVPEKYAENNVLYYEHTVRD